MPIWPSAPRSTPMRRSPRARARREAGGGAWVARIHKSVGAIDAAAWDRLAGADDPFTSHPFLKLLEDSGSVGERGGWSPLPIVIEDEAGLPAAALPAYLKSHSQG